MVAVILLVLCACGAFACCDGDCIEGMHGYSPVAEDAILSQTTAAGMDCSCACIDAVTDQTAYLTHSSVTDIFRPPNTLS
jgi:hypothetical protein